MDDRASTAGFAGEDIKRDKFQVGPVFSLLCVVLACVLVFAFFALGWTAQAVLLSLGMALLYLPAVFFVPTHLSFMERFVLLHLFGLTYAALYFVLDVLAGARLTLWLFIAVSILGAVIGAYLNWRKV